MGKKTLYFKDGTTINIWMDKGGFKNEFVELEFNLSKLGDRDFLRKREEFAQDLIDCDGDIRWPGSDENGFLADIRKFDFLSRYAKILRGYTGRVKREYFFKNVV